MPMTRQARLQHQRATHFSEMSGDEFIRRRSSRTLINQEDSFVLGHSQRAQEAIEGFCSLMLLTKEGIYIAGDSLRPDRRFIVKGPERYFVTMRPARLPKTSTSRWSASWAGDRAPHEGAARSKKARQRLHADLFVFMESITDSPRPLRGNQCGGFPVTVRRGSGEERTP